MVNNTASPSDELSGRDVAALLASTLGWEKSVELVDAVAVSLGFDSGCLDADKAKQILEVLAKQQGIVGVTARFARSRCESWKRAGPPRARQEPPAAREEPRSGVIPVQAAVVEAPASQVVTKRLPMSELVALLAPTMGQEKSNEALAMAARVRGITDSKVTQEQALGLFEVLAGHEGLVGVTARFAKARLVLRFRG